MEPSVHSVLESLELTEYYPILVNEGFDRYASLQNITEEDMAAMNIKRGHRRAIQAQLTKLQNPVPAKSREQVSNNLDTARKPNKEQNVNTSSSCSAAPAQGTQGKMMHINRNVINFHTSSAPVPPVSTSTVITNRTAAAGRSNREGSLASSMGSRRKYRRRPKPDPNAPEKPVSAYVSFSNSVREDIQAQGKSFSEIAKCVGERWKLLPIQEKEKLETHAARTKDAYLSELAQYKCTPEYQDYQRYLTRFYRQHHSSVMPASSGTTDEEMGGGTPLSNGTPHHHHNGSKHLVANSSNMNNHNLSNGAVNRHNDILSRQYLPIAHNNGSNRNSLNNHNLTISRDVHNNLPVNLIDQHDNQHLQHHNDNLNNTNGSNSSNNSNGTSSASSSCSPSAREFPPSSISNNSCPGDLLGSSVSSSGASAARTSCTSRASPGRGEEFSDDSEHCRKKFRSSSISTTTNQTT